MKSRTLYACQQCGHTSPKWVGRCPVCLEWNTLTEETAQSEGPPVLSSHTAPLRFDELEARSVSRVSSGLPEFDRVLGGGVVPGALVLLGGDPGVGKSTLMLEVAARISKHSPVLYVSGEESPLQIKLRGLRMGVESGDLHVFPEMNIERILTAAGQLGAGAVIIDSIQTTFSERLEVAPGSIGQIREVASRLLVWSKQEQVPVFLIGHITKDGSLAGPKALEHVVDTVLYFESPRQHPHRIVRAIKNRFGAANELGIFEMTVNGLKPAARASGLFLSGRERLDAGSAVVCCMEGSRPLLVELQALVSRTHLGTPRRSNTGVDSQRMALMTAVIEKRLGARLWDQDIYLNVVGGLEIEEPAADLGVAAAILSSFLNLPLPASTVVLGEVGLGGEVRHSVHMRARLKEAATFGFRRAILPGKCLDEVPEGFQATGVENLSEAVEALFGPLPGLSG